ncbi:MAG TPA: hypothetical protein VIP46_05490, partial [Pyrinomonadaceae bacterium]
MRRALTTIFVASLAAFAAAAARAQAGSQRPAPAERAQPQQQQARQQSPEAAEVERLSRTVAELYRAGKLKDALPVAERAAALGES